MTHAPAMPGEVTDRNILGAVRSFSAAFKSAKKID